MYNQAYHYHRPRRSIRRWLFSLITGVNFMSIENQVAGLVTAMQAVQTTLTAIQGTLANPPAPPAPTVDFTPVTDAVAALSTKVDAVAAKADAIFTEVNDPSDDTQAPA